MAYNTYLKLDGITPTSQVNIAGQAGKYNGYFEIAEFSFSAAQTSSNLFSGASIGKPSLGPLTLNLRPDTNTPIFFADLCTGRSIATASLVCFMGSGGNSNSYPILQFDMTGVHITGISINGSDGDEYPHLSVIIAFTTITLSSTPQNPDGTLGKPSSANWNLVTNTSS